MKNSNDIFYKNINICIFNFKTETYMNIKVGNGWFKNYTYTIVQYSCIETYICNIAQQKHWCIENDLAHCFQSNEAGAVYVKQNHF